MHWLKDGIDYAGGIWNTPTQGANKYEFYPYVSLAQALYIGGVGQDNRYIFARKFVYPEPQYGNWNPEEGHLVYNSMMQAVIAASKFTVIVFVLGILYIAVGDRKFTDTIWLGLGCVVLFIVVIVLANLVYSLGY